MGFCLVFDSATTPRLWVKRLVIYRSLNPISVIRDIRLHRGLNIIVGKPTFDENLRDNPMAMAGHSVGKTAFCRLLRYCLGEQHFSTESGEERIRACLPLSWAGAEVCLDDVQWAVLRPLGPKGQQPTVLEDATIEELLSSEQNSSSYFEYCQQLEKLLPDNIQHRDMTYKWIHLLAWLSRDQECRLRKLEVWRDSDSWSGTPAFRKPREHPIYLVRGILGLLTSEEAEFSMKYADLVQQKKDLEDKSSIVFQEADYSYALAKKRLEEIIGEFPDTRNDSIFRLDGPRILADTRKSELDKQRIELESELAEIEKHLYTVKMAVDSELQRRKQIEAMLNVTPSESINLNDEQQSDLDKLYKSINSFNECF
jgi:hypothetical protein